MMPAKIQRMTVLTAIATMFCGAAFAATSDDDGKRRLSTVPKSVDEVLITKVAFDVAEDSLQGTVEKLEKQIRERYKPAFPWEIKILARDLQLAGITRNQAIRKLNQKDKTVADVLTAIVMQGNPIVGKREPNSPQQQLVWVVAPDPAAASNRVVLITTRDAANKMKYELPKAFQPPVDKD